MSSLEAALEYAARGWHIHPCKADKSPYTQHGKNDATPDQAEIRSWWNRWPDALIGVNCEPSGLLALDVDNKEGKNGNRAWAELVENFGQGQNVEIGPAQTTPTGGFHLIFKHPPEDIKSKVDKLGPGLDLRSKAYIILAPSTGYEWVDGHGLDTELTEVPEWLLECIRNLEKQPQRAPVPTVKAGDAGKYWLDYYLNKSYPGSRNEGGFSMALQLRDSSIPETEAQSLMIQFAERAPGGDHPYTEREALATLRSAYNGTQREAARLPGLATAHDGRKPADLAQPPDPETQPINEMLLFQPVDHEGHAQCVNFLYTNTFAYSQHMGWLHYNGRYWQQKDAELDVDRAIVNTLQTRRKLAVDNNKDGAFEKLITATKSNTYNVKGTKYLLSSLIYVNIDEFDQEPDLLNCKNGVLDLRTGELQPHSRDQKFTYCLPVDHDPQADYEPWFQFLLEATSFDVDLVAWLKQAIGYSLTGHTFEEILFYVCGPARAGKGTFSETLIAMLGNKPLATETSYETFTADRGGDTQFFDLAPLKPCRFVAASESNKHQALNAASIKRLTGGNYIYCAHKHRDHFSYRPQYKIWLSSNHLANVDVTDTAAWSRIKVIEFPISRVGHEDKSLKKSLVSEKNLRGVLRWAVEGAQEWYQAANGLEFPEAVTKATAAQRDSQDFIQQFLTEMTEDDQGSWIHTGALWESYKAWCDANGVSAKYRNQFSQALKSKDYELSRKRNAEGKLIRVVQGLKMSVTHDTL